MVSGRCAVASSSCAEVDMRVRWKSIAIVPIAFTLLFAAELGRAQIPAQPAASAEPSTQMKRPEFEVASVRQNKSNTEGSMNVAPLLSDTPVSTGGLYAARNIKLIQYIAFAYRLTLPQLQSVVSQAPWVAEDRFDIEARAAGDPTMAQYRLMVQALLADRFKLVVHYETRRVPVYALRLAKAGKLGPQLRLHRKDDPVCSVQAASTEEGSPGVDAEGFPTVCGGPLGLRPSSSCRMKSGGRDLSLAKFAAIETGVGMVDRPMVDETGLKDTVDYSLEWRKGQGQGNVKFGQGPEPDDSAPTFREALEDQLGIRMVSTEAPIELFFVDHVEHPSRIDDRCYFASLT